MTELNTLSAAEAARKIADGEITSEALVQSCLDRIEQRDPDVRAWAYLDGEAALQESRQKDRQSAMGPLHGVPVAIKDVIDTMDMPTAYGSPVYKDYTPDEDADCVRKLKEAGAIILGKTVTTEFATYHPGPTRNPHNLSHSPGGSSSGSAAAVADFQVPLTLGTQTAGSVIRPASYCGIIGFKPSFGRYDVRGMKDTAPHLDTLGGFARGVEDMELLDRVLTSDDTGQGEGGVGTPLTIGVCKTSVWDHAATEMKETLAVTSRNLAQSGAEVVDFNFPVSFDALIKAQKTIHAREAARCFGDLVAAHPTEVSPAFKVFIAQGDAVSEDQYQDSLGRQREAKQVLSSLMKTVDVLLTPGASGAAPKGIEATGDPIFNRLWTLLGVPCLGFSSGVGALGLPLGLQVVGAAGQDRKLLQQAQWLVAHSKL